MKLLPVATTVLVSILLISCGRRILPSHELVLDRVDSLETGFSGGVLSIGIQSSFGIGSCILEFSGEVAADSLRVSLEYGEGLGYSMCEYLDVVAGSGTCDADTLFNGSVRLEAGSMTLPLEGPVDSVSVTWIDYYRS
ncbi:MAG: hypothetical protein AVO35_11360 [Candidatus Aegiribacteria sp. MLS_C]|nr:MAG: hypothetical protein AVO35_11360 [Candidatus Aegiribacteria sp. MLS_C]